MTKIEAEANPSESGDASNLNGKSAIDNDIVGGVVEMECDNVENTAVATMTVHFGEHWTPSKNLVFTMEQDGYCYYEDSISGQQYTMDNAGFWYVWDEAQGSFVAVQEPKSDENSKQPTIIPFDSTVLKESVPPKRKREADGITFDEEGLPVFPTNAKGQPILPTDENEQPFFPVDQDQQFVFPYDRLAKRWTFPVDNTEEPIFPRNMFNKPIVPLNDDGDPIFPIDERGEFIFPLDESHCPIPALTPIGRPVVPRDEFGELVIPRDREGRPLIYMAADEVTPLSLADYRQWKQSCRENAKQQQAALVAPHQQLQQPIIGAAVMQTTLGAPSSIFHPLNLQHFECGVTNEIAMLQRSRRVRPEDIDLPIFATTATTADPSTTYLSSSATDGFGASETSTTATNSKNHNESDNVQQTTAEDEEERARKRKKLLSAQLHFSKRIPQIAPIVKQSDDAGVQQKSEQRPPTDRPAVKKTAVQGNGENAMKSSNLDVKVEIDTDSHNTAKSSKKEKKRKHGRRSPSAERSSSRAKKKHRRFRKSRDRGDSRTPSDRDDEKQEIIKKADSRHDDGDGAESDESQSTYSDGGRCNRDSSPLYWRDGWHANGRENEKQRSDSRGDSVEDAVLLPKRRSEVERRSHTDESDIESNGHRSTKRRRRSPNDSAFDINQLNEYSDLDVVKHFIKHSRRRYDDIKKRIANLEKMKAQEKSLLKKLYDIEARVESRLGMEYMSSSDER